MPKLTQHVTKIHAKWQGNVEIKIYSIQHGSEVEPFTTVLIRHSRVPVMYSKGRVKASVRNNVVCEQRENKLSNVSENGKLGLQPTPPHDETSKRGRGDPKILIHANNMPTLDTKISRESRKVTERFKDFPTVRR